MNLKIVKWNMKATIGIKILLQTKTMSLSGLKIQKDSTHLPISGIGTQMILRTPCGMLCQKTKPFWFTGRKKGNLGNCSAIRLSLPF